MTKHIPEKILIIDDVIKNIQVVINLLKPHNFDIFFATDGASALEKIKEFEFDIILLDIMMPDIDGFEFAENVRRVNKHIPILFMSAKDDLPSKQRGFQLGIDDYMVKPIQLDELLLRVRALLRVSSRCV